jgi:dipeptidyl aminopeptidase/acylaminoacyl peptidase
LSLLVFAGCGGHPVPSHEAGPDEVVALAWLSTTVTMQDAAIVVEQVTYLADGLVLKGQVCRPNDAARHPVLLFDHGGFAGLGTELDGGLCVALARQGKVMLEPSYRGEDGSAGVVEVCRGEVDDVLAMLAIGLVQAYADPSHVGIHGSSHGGCVTLRALEAGAPVRAASEGFGITDMAANYAFWQGELATDPGGTYAGVIQSLVDQLDRSAGGPPASFPAEYQARSPIAFTTALPAVPLMIAHGTADPLVAMTQSCALVKAVGGFRAYHLDASQAVVTTAPAGCDAGTPWLAGPLPSTWPDDRYLLIFDGVGHEFTSAGGQAMALDLVTFVLAKL